MAAKLWKKYLTYMSVRVHQDVAT